MVEMPPVKPITPKEVRAGNHIPLFVIDAFNSCIAAKFNAGTAVVKQDDVIEKLVRISGVTRDLIFERGWLNVESLYEKSGWSVSYDKPAYNETYPATFTFEEKK